MKKFLAWVVAAIMMFAFAACGEKTPADGSIIAPEVSQLAPPSQSDDDSKVPESSVVEASGAQESAWMQTKTGKFYSQFSDGMYMEYEMEYDGMVMTVTSATSGGKTYSESKMDGQNAGVSVMDGKYLYAIDHNSKTVIKMSLQASGQEIVNTMMQEQDVDPAAMKSGTREIEGKTYDTEEWSMEGAKSILCFDGAQLAYMIGELEGEETVLKVIKTERSVDARLFEIPSDYQMISY